MITTHNCIERCIASNAVPHLLRVLLLMCMLTTNFIGSCIQTNHDFHLLLVVLLDALLISLDYSTASRRIA